MLKWRRSKVRNERTVNLQENYTLNDEAYFSPVHASSVVVCLVHIPSFIALLQMLIFWLFYETLFYARKWKKPKHFESSPKVTNMHIARPCVPIHRKKLYVLIELNTLEKHSLSLNSHTQDTNSSDRHTFAFSSRHPFQMANSWRNVESEKNKWNEQIHHLANKIYHIHTNCAVAFFFISFSLSS